MSNLTSKEVIIAVIGLIGVLVTALLSNWDKLFPKKNELKTTFSGYRSTGIFETELRYFFEVTGLRKMVEDMQLQFLQNHKISKIQQYPNNAEEIESIFKVLAEEILTLDDVLKKLLPAYQRYYSIEELQELNRFYSTEIMQNMVKKNTALTIEVAPLQIEIMQEYKTKINQIISSRMLAQLKTNGT